MIRLPSRVLLLVLMAAAFATGVAAGPGRTYHVATDGSGDFRSVADVNAAALAPGDHVLLRRGDTFRGTGLVAQPGVTYGAYGSGTRPQLTGIDGTGFVAAARATLRDVSTTETTGHAIWADRAPGIAIERVDVARVFTRAPERTRRSIEIYHSDDARFADSTVDHTGAGSQVYLFNSNRAVVSGNRLHFRGPLFGGSGAGDAIVLAASSDFRIVGNEIHYTGGSKGAIQVLSHWAGRTGGLIAHNDVTGGQFGISPRQPGVIVENNVIRDVGNQDFSARWATAILLSHPGGDAGEADATGMVIRNNLIVNCRQAIAGWDAVDGYLTGHDIHNNTIVGAAATYFARHNGDMAGAFRNNLVVDAGGMALSKPFRRFRDYGNYFFRVDGRADSGPDPRLDARFRPTVDIGDAGIRPGTAVGLPGPPGER